VVGCSAWLDVKVIRSPTLLSTRQSRLKASSLVALGDVHPRLELPDLDAGGDVGAPQSGIAPHDVKQAPADLAPQSLRSAGREEDRGVHEATAIGTDMIRVTSYGAAFDPLRLEALRITERIVEPVEQIGQGVVVAEIARVLQDDMRHAFVLNVARARRAV